MSGTLKKEFDNIDGSEYAGLHLNFVKADEPQNTEANDTAYSEMTVVESPKLEPELKNNEFMENIVQQVTKVAGETPQYLYSIAAVVYTKAKDMAGSICGRLVTTPLKEEKQEIENIAEGYEFVQKKKIFELKDATGSAADPLSNSSKLMQEHMNNSLGRTYSDFSKSLDTSNKQVLAPSITESVYDRIAAKSQLPNSSEEEEENVKFSEEDLDAHGILKCNSEIFPRQETILESVHEESSICYPSTDLDATIYLDCFNRNPAEAKIEVDFDFKK
jgi:hypothetical protein